jgi:hypothetical protein
VQKGTPCESLFVTAAALDGKAPPYKTPIAAIGSKEAGRPPNPTREDLKAAIGMSRGVRRLDRRFPAVSFLEGRLEVFFDMIGNRLRQSGPIRGHIRKCQDLSCVCASGGRGSFQSVKLQRPARATVCSHSVRDATASIELSYRFAVPLEWSKMHASGRNGCSLMLDKVQKTS